jgi:hypothetical protein
MLIAIVGMIFIITIPPLIFGLYYMCVQVMKGKTIKFTDVFKGFDYFFRSWGLILLSLLAISVGLIFLIIPGLILIILFQYAIAVAIIENKGPIEALRRSYQIGKENFIFSIVLLIVLSVIQSIGTVTRVGMLLTIPFVTLCMVVATDMLTKRVKDTVKVTVKKEVVKKVSDKKIVEEKVVEKVPEEKVVEKEQI